MQQTHYLKTVRATYMDLYTIGCTVEPLLFGILKDAQGPLKLSVPPIWIYTPSDAQMEPPIIWYNQKCVLI